MLLVFDDGESECHGGASGRGGYADEYHGQQFEFQLFFQPDGLDFGAEYGLDTGLHDGHEWMHESDGGNFYCQHVSLDIGDEPGQRY
jgi:hypothetical protein